MSLPILPLQVAQHLAKLFDSMSSLKFKLDELDNPTNEASGMFSKDGEYVDFDKPCHCVGQVSLFVYASVFHIWTLIIWLSLSQG